MPTTTVAARAPCWLRFISTGTQRGTAPGIQSGVNPARASSATRIAMRLPPIVSGSPATVAAITSASSWVDAHGLVIVEAKGSHDKAVRAWRGPSGIPSVLQSAIGQTERTAVFVRASNRKLPSKRWAIASRWGTQENGRDPTLIAWDPEDGKLDEEDYRSLARVFLQADMQAVAAGMGYTGGGGAFGVVGDFGRKPTIEEGLSIRLKVGERHIAPGLAVVLGPFGALPIRSAKDLLRIRQAREISPKIALVSLSTKYIQSVREGEHPVEDPLYTEDRAASQGGLTVIWPHEKEEVQIDE